MWPDTMWIKGGRILKDIIISMSCVSCRSSEHIPETNGTFCNKHDSNVDNLWPCVEWLPSKPDKKIWIAREKDKRKS